MVKFLRRTLWMAVVCALVTCNQGVCAGKFADAGKFTIQVLTDPGDQTGLTARQVEQRSQVLKWMGPDLIRVLERRGGYKARLINARDDFKAGDDTYLLAVKITKYNPGSKGARMVVGFGAGAVSLDIHYELSGKAQEPILAKDDGVGSSMEWTRCCRKLNENILAAVDAKFKEFKESKGGQ